MDLAQDIHPREVCQRKYYALKRKCEELQQSNEKLVNRIFHIKKIIKRFRTERRSLVDRLGDYGDNVEGEEVPAMWEDALFPAEDDPLEDGGDAAPPDESKMDCSQSEGAPAAGGSKRSGKGKSGGEGGKKPINAFLMYCQMRRSLAQEQHVKEQGEEMTQQELMKSLSQEWHSLSAEEKKVYYDLAEKQKIAKRCKEQANVKDEVDATASASAAPVAMVTDSPLAAQVT